MQLSELIPQKTIALIKKAIEGIPHLANPKKYSEIIAREGTETVVIRALIVTISYLCFMNFVYQSKTNALELFQLPLKLVAIDLMNAVIFLTPLWLLLKCFKHQSPFKYCVGIGYTYRAIISFPIGILALAFISTEEYKYAWARGISFYLLLLALMVGMGFFAFHSTRKKIGFTIVTVFVTAFCLLVYGNLTFKYFSKRNNEFNSSPLFDPIAHEFKEICTSSERIKRDYKASSVFDMPYELIKSRKVISDSLALLNRHDLQNMADQWAKDSAFERIKLNDVSKLIDQLQANAKFGSSKEYLKSFKAFNNQKITMMALLQQYSLDKPGNHFNDLLLCDKRIVQLETEMLRIKLDQYKKMIPLYEYWLSYY